MVYLSWSDARTLSVAWYISLDVSVPNSPRKILKSWHGVSYGDARTLSMAWCILGDARTINMARCISLHDSLPWPSRKTLKSSHGVSWGDARTLSVAWRISLDDLLPRPPGRPWSLGVVFPHCPDCPDFRHVWYNYKVLLFITCLK